MSFGDEEVNGLLQLKVTPRPNSTGLDKLIRFDVAVPSWFPIQDSSYAPTLYIHYKSICACGQINIARSLLGLLFIISKKAKRQSIAITHYDDYIRQHLKYISADSFAKTFNTSPAYMFFVHLHALGAKTPYRKQDILDDVSAWVNDDKSFPHVDYVKSKLDHVFATWNVSFDDTLYLPFRSYCNDVLRWGTSGGAKKSDFLGETFRTKWAWGFSHLTTDEGKEINENADLYEMALLQGEKAHVALKEEATKTRPVITASMASYLRQSYLLYRWGKPPINSPIASRTWLPIFQSTNYRWYGCLDGDRFDQTIPAWVILYIMDKLGDISEECRWVADAEIAAMKTLVVEWGEHSWRWLGGLLSGWRVTSLIGSLVSMCVAEFISEHSGHLGAFSYGVMGDDLILYSNTASLTPEQMCSLYNAFGLKANLSKTTSGNIGEYLRKTYSDRGILGYPCLALRTCVYANPWISTYELEFEEEISNGWLTYYSRLLPLRTSENLHPFIFNTIKLNLRQKSINKFNWDNWLQTPISAGGGGPSEWSNPKVWTVIRREKYFDRVPSFYSTVGLVKPKRVALRDDTLHKLDYDRLQRRVESLKRASLAYPVPRIPKNVNITATLFNWFVNDDYSAVSIEKLLGYQLPRGLRAAGKNAILDYILGKTKEKTGISSVQSTKEVVSLQNRIVKFITHSIASAKYLNGVRNLGAAATIYATAVNSGRDVVYGTW